MITSKEQVSSRRSATLTFQILLIGSVLLLLIAMAQLCLPIKFGVDDSAGNQWEVNNYSRLFPFAEIPWLAFPWMIFVLTARRQIVLAVFGIVALSTILFCATIVYLKLTMTPNPPPYPSYFENILVTACLYWALFYVFILIPVFVMLFIASTYFGYLGVTSRSSLMQKGYAFSFHERALLLRRADISVLKQIPSRDELALIPGYGDGSVEAVAALMREIMRRR